MRAVIILLLLVDLPVAFAQEDDRPLAPYRPGREHHDELTLRTGYHQGTYGFAELGLGRSVYGMGHLPYGAGLHAGMEVRVDRPSLIGLKAGFFVSSVFAFGAHYIRYMEDGAGMDVLRPELGFALGKAKLTYAVNLGLSRPELEGVGTHLLSLTYDLRLRRLRGDDAWRSER
jgi:hypothetical protein